MRVLTLLITLLLVCMTGVSQAQEDKTPAGPTSPAESETSTKEKASLIIGFSIMARSKAQGTEFDIDKVIEGLKKADTDESIDSFVFGYTSLANIKRRNMNLDMAKLIEGLKLANSGSELGMENEEVLSVQKAFQANERKRMQMEKIAIEEANKAEGEKYITEFAAQENVMEVEDGVKYMVMKAGEGATPSPTDRVKVHYEGSYIDGEVFDSSIKKGEPLTLGVRNFVPGFSAALQKMKVGGKWKVAIRGDKAYGGRPPQGMEPFKTLIFELELLEIIKPAAKAPAPGTPPAINNKK